MIRIGFFYKKLSNLKIVELRFLVPQGKKCSFTYQYSISSEKIKVTQFARLCRIMTCLQEIMQFLQDLQKRYLFNITPTRNPSCITGNHANIPLYKTNHNLFKNSSFSSTVIEWNDLDPNLINSVLVKLSEISY